MEKRGGSYKRNADGSLTLVECTLTEEEAAAAKSTAKPVAAAEADPTEQPAPKKGK
jgi:hypothetical protein